jgi:hypothetical protein
MFKKIMVALTIIISNQLTAQITINVNDLANPGDTVLVGISTQYTTVDFASTGPNYYWDFSYLTANTQRIDTFFDVSSASVLYQLSFNNFLSPNYQADYYQKVLNNNLPSIPGGGVSIDKPVVFTKNSSSKSENVGIGVEVNGVEIPVRADTIDIAYQFPMTYNTNWISRSYLNMDMNPAFNAIFVRHQLRDATVDGWGSITTPFGTFDAVRVKSILTYTDSIQIDLTGTGNPVWFAIPTPQDIEYTWWTNNNKIPILKMIVRANVATSIEFRDKVSTVSLKSDNFNHDVIVFPNPAQQYLTLSMPVSKNNNYQIFDLTGKLILTGQATSQNTNIDVSHLQKGVYMIKITSNQYQTIKQFVKE